MAIGSNARAIMIGVAVLVVIGITAFVAIAMAENAPPPTPPAAAGKFFKPQESQTTGSVTVNGGIVNYTAVAGTLVVHPKGWDDVKPSEDDKNKDKDKNENSENPSAEAQMFYVAYFKRDVAPGSRPITFLYNGGPGSSTVWLHMGAFGPRRVVTADDSHTPAAPYSLINNNESLLDASDLVFVDAPGTGFSRIAGGKDKDEREKAFFGMDADAYAFSQFIMEFLSRWQRWNSPKYLFGESYGTPRSAIVVNELETDNDIDFNGVILLSQILNFDLSPDGPDTNPGVDLPYVLALPTYAATAWYHKKLPGQEQRDLASFVHEVERFATTDYYHALEAGAGLSEANRNAIAQKLHGYTGLPVSYILKADLRIDGGEFEKNLQDSNNLTTGRLDTRFSGPSLDPLSKEAEYDPQAAAISSAYVSAFNDYVRNQLKFGQDQHYKPELDVFRAWDFKHQQPGMREALQTSPNVMPDLATAMKYNPQLKIQLNGGYFDLATPYYEGWYEMHHLPIPKELQNNIEYRYYASGHMVYAHEQSLKELHDNVADFIRRTDNVR